MNARVPAAHVLIVEDDEDLLQALTALLEQSGYVVESSRDGAAAFAALTHQCYDLALIDLTLPGLDGLTLVRRLRAHMRDLPVLIITARQSVKDRVAGLDAGADDYLVKPFQMAELEARIRALLRRPRIDPQQGVLRIGEIELLLEGARISAAGVSVDLSSGELALLHALLARHGRVVSKDAIAERLGNGVSPASNTAIEICVHRLRRRLDPLGLKIRTLRGFGYLLEPQQRS